ncbi:MAG: M14 family metallopeptidase [Planctomycetes bacterium]|nr:M14 family metallopeptidase [Planctomycetota bacterium]NUQ33442.1 succinylglutamate desuccinylase/aspartoacylase family protein [Planctomycetaceae bacterium]
MVRIVRENEPITIGNVTVQPGERAYIEVPLARLPTNTWMSIPIAVVNGINPGPNLWLNAAIHGDEINGVDVIRRVLKRIKPKAMSGVLITVPIVNIIGFLNQSRYLPDRRDLNRLFPGSARGSLGSRMAHFFMTEVVARCDYGVDMHTGAFHRNNLPQIRADLSDEGTRELAFAFGTPIVINSSVRDGSLRAEATELGKRVLLYEAGEPSRFSESAIKIGVQGVMNLMRFLGMLEGSIRMTRKLPWESDGSTWLRAKRGGILRTYCDVGDIVEEGEPVGVISDTFDEDVYTLKAPASGVVVGITKLPLVNQGDGILHVANIKQLPSRRRIPRRTIFLEK